MLAMWGDVNGQKKKKHLNSINTGERRVPGQWHRSHLQNNNRSKLPENTDLKIHRMSKTRQGLWESTPQHS